jgi:hypothetical protein
MRIRAVIRREFASDVKCAWSGRAVCASHRSPRQQRNRRGSLGVILDVVLAKSRMVGACIASVAVLVAGCSSGGGQAVKVHVATTPTQSKTTVGNGPRVAAPVLGTYADAVGYFGSTEYPGVYASDRQNPDGSVTVYVGPGSDGALLARLRHMSPIGIAGLPRSGAFPTLHVVRVSLSFSELEKQAKAFEHARLPLAARGYRVSGVTPKPELGEIDVAFHSVPAGVTVASATRHIDSTIAPNIVVTSVNAAYATFG